MQHLLLIYRDATSWTSLSARERDAMRDGLAKDGRSSGASSSATVVRVRDGGTLTTDGPFEKTKEQLGGYSLSAEDLDAAVTIAARIPAARFGSMKVRPLWECANAEARPRPRPAAPPPAAG